MKWEYIRVGFRANVHPHTYIYKLTHSLTHSLALVSSNISVLCHICIHHDTWCTRHVLCHHHHHLHLPWHSNWRIAAWLNERSWNEGRRHIEILWQSNCIDSRLFAIQIRSLEILLLWCMRCCVSDFFFVPDLGRACERFRSTTSMVVQPDSIPSILRSMNFVL